MVKSYHCRVLSYLFGLFMFQDKLQTNTSNYNNLEAGLILFTDLKFRAEILICVIPV